MTMPSVDRRYDFGKSEPSPTEDVNQVRFAVQYGGSPTFVDVIVADLAIEPEELGAARAPAPPRWHWWFPGRAGDRRGGGRRLVAALARQDTTTRPRAQPALNREKRTMRPTAIVLTVLVGSVLPALAEEKHVDFRHGQLGGDELAFEGQTPDQYFRAEPEGLRLRFTAGEAPKQTVGLHWRYVVRGDFTTTVRYEILHANPPATAWGTGLELYLWLANSTRDGISFSWLAPTRVRQLGDDGVIGLAFQQPALTFFHMTSDDAGKRLTKMRQAFEEAARPRRGQLRLARVGPTLIASAAAEDSGQFEELLRTEIGTMDIATIRVGGVSGGDPQAVLDSRILEFDLTGDELRRKSWAPPAVSPPVADVPTTPRYLGWVLLAATVLALAATGIVAWLVYRRRQTLARAGRYVVTECPHCGKRLKLPADKLGKQRKCPACARPFSATISRPMDPPPRR